MSDPGFSAHDRAAMERALELADAAGTMGEVPVGAVVYETDSGRTLGEGSNTRERDADPMGHAELRAIAQACRTIGDWRLNHCTLVVTLEPCPMCAGGIVNARLGRVVYGCDDPKAGACRSLFSLVTDPRLNHRAELLSGLEAERCAALLRAFFKRLRDA